VSHPEFIALVKQMRASQTRFFQARAVYDMQEAKRLERLVDLAIKDAEAGPHLFDERSPA
jgi:hypothetical protein